MAAMNRFLPVLAALPFFLFSCALPAAAQEKLPAIPEIAHPMGRVFTQPQCFPVENRAPYTVFGTISTDFYVDEQGIQTRHTQNFRLAANEKVQVCATGPFYPGEQLEFTLRTMIPVLTCKVTPAAGPLVITGRLRGDGTTETTATCR
jgi:hypothetical protein